MCRRVRLTLRLGRTLGGLVPAGEDQDGRMAVKRARKHLGALDAQADAVSLNSRQRRLRNAAQFGELVLAKTLKLADDPQQPAADRPEEALDFLQLRLIAQAKQRDIDNWRKYAARIKRQREGGTSSEPTENPPADSPKIVTRDESPPNRPMLRRTHSSAAI